MKIGGDPSYFVDENVTAVAAATGAQSELNFPQILNEYFYSTPSRTTQHVTMRFGCKRFLR